MCCSSCLEPAAASFKVYSPAPEQGLTWAARAACFTVMLSMGQKGIFASLCPPDYTGIWHLQHLLPFLCDWPLCLQDFFFPHFSHSSASHLLCCAFTFFQICYHTGTTSFTDVFCFWLEAGLIWSWLKWFFTAQGQLLVSTLPLTCKWNTGTPSWAADHLIYIHRKTNISFQLALC